MTSLPKRRIFWVNRPTENLTGWKRWVDMEKLMPRLVDICGYELPTNLQNFTQKDITKVKIFQKVFFLGGGTFFETPGTLYPSVRSDFLQPSVISYISKDSQRFQWKSSPGSSSRSANLITKPWLPLDKLSCRRETAQRFVSLNILLSDSRLLEVIRNDTVE